MREFFHKINNQKWIVLIILLAVVFLFQQLSVRSNQYPQTYEYQVNQEKRNLDVGMPSSLFTKPNPSYDAMSETAPTITSPNRMVQTNSSLSLVVENVEAAQTAILETTRASGGYMIQSSLQNPQDNATSTITVRVPTKQMNKVLAQFKNLAKKVSSENLQGIDITDQYVDNQARLKTLQLTKAKFEEMLVKSTQISDILNVQRELMNLQAQIDSIEGQQKYSLQSAELTLITLYLSTDEFALPYQPSTSWRPEVVFKEAVRSLIGFMRQIANSAIWLLVYGVFLLPLVVGMLFLYKKLNRKKIESAQLTKPNRQSIN